MRLKDLASHLNLSQTTVSRALNGYPEVSGKTRERVLAAAQALNYVPSGRAKSLATGRNMIIGHVIPVSTRREIVNPVFGDFVAGAGEVYAARGYEMLLTLVPDEEEPRIYREMHARGQVDGIVVHGPRMADHRIALLSDMGLPFVVHGRASDIAAPYAFVDVANTRAFDEATRHLISLGHRRIGLLNGLEKLDFAHRRRTGFLAALARAGLPADPKWMRSDDMTESYGHAAARDMLALSPAPTSFVTSSIIIAIGVRRAVQDLGLKLRKDISIVTFDDALSYLSNEAAPNEEPVPSEPTAIFTAMRSSVRAAGKRVAELLLDQIANPDDPPQTAMMDLQLVPGCSTGPVARESAPHPPA